MQETLKRFESPIFIVDCVLAFVILLFIFFMTSKFLKRKTVLVFFAIGFVVYIITYIFELNVVSNIVWTTLAIGFILLCFVNIGDIRPLLVNPLKNKKKVAAQKYDKDGFFKIINDAVNKLSRSKTGALITFERNTPLTDYYKSGTMVNAPVSSELLETIFYEGTRLHDGAVIIRDNIIVCASVYYTPTTRALTGKYGARHRAALGISEITDSLTVIVSEETGRVSIAHNGLLEQVKLDEFPKIFREAMN